MLSSYNRDCKIAVDWLLDVNERDTVSIWAHGLEVMTYSEFNHLIYTTRSSIRNQYYMPCLRTQQEQLMPSLVSAPLIPSDTCWRVYFCFSYSLILVFCRAEWSTFEMNLVFIWRNFWKRWGHWIYVGNGTTHSLKRVTCPLITSSCVAIRMLINATIVIKFSVGGDWDLFGDQSREIGTRNYEKDKHIQALIVELYLHVSSVNYDGCPVMIDMMSTLKYQRLQSTIAHEDWRRRIVEAASVMERVLVKKNV